MNLDQRFIDDRVGVVKPVVHAVEHVNVQRLIVRDGHRFAQSQYLARAVVAIEAGIPLHQVLDEHGVVRHHRFTKEHGIDAPLNAVGVQPGRFVDAHAPRYALVALRGGKIRGSLLSQKARDTTIGLVKTPIDNLSVIS